MTNLNITNLNLSGYKNIDFSPGCEPIIKACEDFHIKVRETYDHRLEFAIISLCILSLYRLFYPIIKPKLPEWYNKWIDPRFDLLIITLVCSIVYIIYFA